MPLLKKFHPKLQEEKIYQRVLEYYLCHLDENVIPYWDLTFKKNDKQPRDSSSAAIVADGLILAQKYGYEKKGMDFAKGILWYLGQNYLTNEEQDGLLQHGVYSYAEDKGVNEANLWGDYFYLESLMRLYDVNWMSFW